MKRFRIVIISVILSMFLCLPVMALDLDIIEDEKKEEIKDDYKEEEKKENIGGAKYQIQVSNAKTIYFTFNNVQYFCNVDNLSVGRYYNIKLELSNNVYIITPSDSIYFKRRSEGSTNYVSGRIWYNGVVLSDITISGDTMAFNTSDGITIGEFNPDDYVIEEPTPEPTPTPDEPTVSDNTVSWNSVSENLISIENEIRGLRKDVQNLANNTFSVSISNINVSDNQVSRNVISTGLQDYDLGEQLQLIGLILAFGALLVYIIHKSIYKWGR